MAGGGDPIADGTLFSPRRSSSTRASCAAPPSPAPQQTSSPARPQNQQQQNASSSSPPWRSPGGFGSPATRKTGSAEGGDGKASSSSAADSPSQWRRSPNSTRQVFEDGAACAIRNSFESLVRSSPLPKVLQQQSHQNGSGQGPGSRVSPVAMAAPKAVRGSLVPPPRFEEDRMPQEQSNVSSRSATTSVGPNFGFDLSPPKRRAPDAEGGRLSLFGDWWLVPSAEEDGSHDQGGGGRQNECGTGPQYAVRGTEYSSFVEDASDAQGSQRIDRRLGPRLLQTEGGRHKVKLVGRANDKEMRRHFHPQAASLFVDGVPENWLDVLAAHRVCDRASEGGVAAAMAEVEEVDASNAVTETGDLGQQPGDDDDGDDDTPSSDDFKPLKPRGRRRLRKTGSAAAVSPKLERRDPDPSPGTPREKPSPSGRPRGRPPGRKRRESPHSKFRDEEEENVVSTQAIGGFRTSSRGRRIVPRLDFWKNEGVKYDRGEVIGVKMREKDAEPAAVMASPVKRRAPRRPSGGEGSAIGKRRRGRPPKKPKAEVVTPPPGAVAAAGDDENVSDDIFDLGVEVRSSDEGGDGEVGADEWTPEQAAALSWAQLKVDPTARNFWQEVAKQVPGNKTADECFQRHFHKHPTPVARKTRSLTGGGDDTVVASAPSAQVKRQMKQLRGKPAAKAPGRQLEEEGDPLGMTQALLGGGGGGQHKTLAAAIVSALAEAQPEGAGAEEEEEEDFYFDEDDL